MQLGVVGLGRMGANIVRRVQRAGHQCVVYDRDPAAARALETEGAIVASTVAELASRLTPPRAVWVMVPAAVTGGAVMQVADALESGDTVIDGGNSYYRDDISRAAALAPRGITYLDVGTSGGVFGLERGFCLMIGGESGAVARLEPVFAALAPGRAAAPRTPSRTGTPTTAEEGYLHCGPVGAGHFAKMVHNGIEYGLMQAFAEGFNILRHAGAGRTDRAHDAETAPLREPEHYQYDFDLAAVAELWRRGSVVASWLLDLTADALSKSPQLAEFGGHVADSGEGRWTVQAAVDEGVPAPVLSAALFARFSSQGAATFGDQLLSAMRAEFGGHAEKPRSSGDR